MGADFQEAAPAKINLALHVREQMADGYHRLETIFAFARDGDRLSVAPAKDISLVIEGHFANGLSDKDNLVIRAADALRDASGSTGGGALRLEREHLQVERERQRPLLLPQGEGIRRSLRRSRRVAL